MKLQHITLLIFLLAISIAGCTPKSNCASSGGGKGGTAKISITPSHYGAYVDSFTVYIKYGTLDAPTNGSYDDSQKCALVDTIPTATFSNLKAGLYYFYGEGYHKALKVDVTSATNFTMCSEHTQSRIMPTGP